MTNFVFYFTKKLKNEDVWAQMATLTNRSSLLLVATDMFLFCCEKWINKHYFPADWRKANWMVINVTFVEWKEWAGLSSGGSEAAESQ